MYSLYYQLTITSTLVTDDDLDDLDVEVWAEMIWTNDRVGGVCQQWCSGAAAACSDSHISCTTDNEKAEESSQLRDFIFKYNCILLHSHCIILKQKYDK